MRKVTEHREAVKIVLEAMKRRPEEFDYEETLRKNVKFSWLLRYLQTDEAKAALTKSEHKALYAGLQNVFYQSFHERVLTNILVAGLDK